ncbi:phosphoribosylanthranilate isomerase [Chloroflexota bacterium]
MTRVKICGISEEVHALAAVEAGADLIGLVFAPSPRQVTLAQAEKVAAAVRQGGSGVGIVGVFVNMPPVEVNKIAGSCNLDWVQLSGDESGEYCREITSPVIKAIRVGERGQVQNKLHTMEEALAMREHLYLLDSRVEGKYGGTGETFDWNQVRKVADKFPVIVAGGLTAENVAEAIRITAPWGVDVSSGVETDGRKDTAKIRAFFEAVRKAEGDIER